MKRKQPSTASGAAKKPAKRMLLGLGLDGAPDGTDGEGVRRVTRARDALLVGGSKETHERMQETTIRFNEELDRRGIRLSDVRCADELREIAEKAGM